ncbi:hypothetical protein K435DRAFT_652408 [Dendrothele bispora CBS 962.96]|uniref:Ketoreductase (KR) domain-containing protein n=1 Tax=Dendrothele bispora (strain CBS 962.96) TaxID=1314807 RepID=A0A4S8MJ80_DENBC|nr:hypothetical protein K435DRAFT_652408 [Dendrothele bispora CBS 962.96]
MVLQIIFSFPTYFPETYNFLSSHIPHITVGTLSLYTLFLYSQGRNTTRERDLHARTFLLTGGFTPIGLTVLKALAERGAHVIALTSANSTGAIDDPRIELIVDVLRNTTSNEKIFAEECDLTSPASIEAFCKKFVEGEEKRLDGVVFMHEYAHVGVLGLFRSRKALQRKRDQLTRDVSSLSTFLFTTLLLPCLLTAPVERDIRIVNVVNRFYPAAAAAPSFNPGFESFSDSESSESSLPVSSTGKGIFLSEGTRALKTVLFIRHLQRILDALPSAQVPKTSSASSAVPVVKTQKSNIVAVSVSPGISRVDTVSGMLGADWSLGSSFSVLGLLLYLSLLLPLRIFTKSPTSAIQSILHALFLPTPFKIVASDTPAPSTSSTSSPSSTQTPSKSSSPNHAVPSIEILKPGALYAECAVVDVKISPAIKKEMSRLKPNSSSFGPEKGKTKQKEAEETMDLPDDGEYGGEEVGRKVWEAYEGALKIWQSKEKAKAEEVEKAQEKQ